MRARRMILASATAVVTAALGAVSSLPAEAAQGFSIATTSRGIDDGSTHATGSITFTGEKSFRISSTVWDSCPGDGRGAYLAMAVQFMDGSGYAYSWGSAFNKDTNGCDNGKISNTVNRTYSKRVKNVSVTLFETDTHPPAYQSVSSSKKDNPNT